MRVLIYAFIILLTSAIWSCRTVKYVPVESVERIRDSVVVRDSVVWHDRVRERDSVVTRDSVVMVVDGDGNVVRTELYRQKEVYRELREEYDRLMAAYRQLESERRDSVQVPYPVEMPLTRWQQWKMDLGGWAMGGIVVVMVLLGIKIFRKL